MYIVYYLLRPFKRFIRASKYFIFEWNRNDWDYSYLIESLIFRISMLRKEITKNSVISDEDLKQIIDSTTETEKLLQKFVDDEYYGKGLEWLEKKYNVKIGHDIIKLDNGYQLKTIYKGIEKYNEDEQTNIKAEFDKLLDSSELNRNNDLVSALDIIKNNIYKWWD